MSALFYKRQRYVCKKGLNVEKRKLIFSWNLPSLVPDNKILKISCLFQVPRQFGMWHRVFWQVNKASEYLTWVRGNNTSPLCDFRGVTSQTWLYAVLWRQSITIQGRQPPASSYIDKNRHRTSLSTQAAFLELMVSSEWSATPPTIKQLENSS